MPFRGVYLFALLLLDLLFACQGIIRASSRLLVQPGIVLFYRSASRFLAVQSGCTRVLYLHYIVWYRVVKLFSSADFAR